MGALVFVTCDLYPFAPGAAGRALHNLLKTMDPADRARSIVVALDCPIDPAAFAETFPGARLVAADSADESGRFDFGGRHPVRRFYESTPQHWRSAVVFRALRRLAAELALDYIEFPDRDGLAFVATQEKRLSSALGDARIAVRLGAPRALLLHHAASVVTFAELAIADQERKALRDCDLVVAAHASVADHFCRWLGFASEEWRPRLALHAPSVWLEGAESAAAVPAAARAVAFGGSFHAVDRPDLFMRGFAALCNASPDFAGRARYCADEDGDHDPVCRETALRLIPRELAARFTPDLPPAGAAREKALAHSVFVAPGAFDAVGLSAWEASRLGAIPVLNQDNPAFAAGSPWIDGVNCIMFSGGALALGRALQRALALAQPLAPVVAAAQSWPWTAPRPPAAAPAPGGEPPLVSVIAPHFNLAEFLPETLACLRDQTYGNIEVIVVDDASTEGSARDLLARLRLEQNAKFRLIAPPANVGLSGARNLGVAAARGRYILPLDADDLIDPRFIAIAVAALERHREFDLVVPQAGYFERIEQIPAPGEARDLEDFATFLGEAPLCGVWQNRFSTCTALIRAELLRQNPYQEAMRAYEDWSLFLRLIQQNARALVTTDALFFYRNRPASMVKEGLDPARRALLVHDLLRHAVEVKNLPPLAYLAFAPRPPAAPEVVERRIDVWPFALARETARRLIVKAAKREILLCRIKRFLLYPLPRQRRRQHDRLREWKTLLRDVQGWA